MLKINDVRENPNAITARTTRIATEARGTLGSDASKHQLIANKPQLRTNPAITQPVGVGTRAISFSSSPAYA
jgi:hypothetical protein